MGRTGGTGMMIIDTEKKVVRIHTDKEYYEAVDFFTEENEHANIDGWKIVDERVKQEYPISSIHKKNL